MNLQSITSPNLDGNLNPDAHLAAIGFFLSPQSTKRAHSVRKTKKATSSFSTTEKPRKTLFSYPMVKEESVCCIPKNNKSTKKGASDSEPSSSSSSSSSPTIEQPLSTIIRKRKKSGTIMEEEESLSSSSSSSNTVNEKSKRTRVTFKFRGNTLFTYQTMYDRIINPILKGPTHKEESDRPFSRRIKKKLELQHYKAVPTSSSSSLTVDKPEKKAHLCSFQSSDSDDEIIMPRRSLLKLLTAKEYTRMIKMKMRSIKT